MVFRVGYTQCHKCKDTYRVVGDIEITQGTHGFYECPECGQMNAVEFGPVITGMCTRCQKPLDDHLTSGDCPPS